MGENTLQISTPKLLKHWEKFVSSCEGFFFFEPARRVSPGSCSLSLSFSYTVCLKNGEIPSKVFPTFHNNFYVYRVSHNEMSESQCFWGVEGSIILLIFLWRHVQEQCTFEFHQQIFLQMTQPVLHSLRSEGCQNWTLNSMILPKKFMFSKHQNKMILAIRLLNSSS